MNPPPQLSGTQLRTFETLFQHPVSHNLAWHDVHALFRQLGQVTEETNGNLKVTLHGQTMVLPPPRKKDISDPDDLMKIRRFLTRSETPALAATAPSSGWLLVLTHHAARIFRSTLPGTAAQELLSGASGEHFRHAPDSKDFSRGGEKPDPNTFFEPIVQALKGADRILCLGSGTGNANEMEQFIAWAKVHHGEWAKRIVGSRIVDLHHVTDAELLAKAREFYALPHSGPVAPA